MGGNCILQLGWKRMFGGETIIQDEGVDASGFRQMGRQLAMAICGVGNASAAMRVDNYAIGRRLDRFGENGRYAAGVDLLVGDSGWLRGEDMKILEQKAQISSSILGFALSRSEIVENSYRAR